MVIKTQIKCRIYYLSRDKNAVKYYQSSPISCSLQLLISNKGLPEKHGFLYPCSTLLRATSLLLWTKIRELWHRSLWRTRLVSGSTVYRLLIDVHWPLFSGFCERFWSSQIASVLSTEVVFSTAVACNVLMMSYTTPVRSWRCCWMVCSKCWIPMI